MSFAGVLQVATQCVTVCRISLRWLDGDHPGRVDARPHRRRGRQRRRHTNGIYTLEPKNGSTVVCFTNEIEPAGVGDRIAPPLIRAYLRRQNARALDRLKEQMETR